MKLEKFKFHSFLTRILNPIPKAERRPTSTIYGSKLGVVSDSVVVSVMSGNIDDHSNLRFNLLNGNSTIIVKKSTGNVQLGVVVVAVVVVAVVGVIIVGVSVIVAIGVVAVVGIAVVVVTVVGIVGVTAFTRGK